MSEADNDPLLSQIRQLIEDQLVAENYELVEWKKIPRGFDYHLTLLVDRFGGGITIAQCAYLNTKVGKLFESHPEWPQPSMLEVSSPGLDRPLTTPKDFKRVLSKSVWIATREKWQGDVSHRGDVEAVDEEGIQLKRKSDGAVYTIPFSLIVSSRRDITLKT